MLISFLRSHFFGRRFLQRGFTLVELLVVLAIITILTALILFQHRRFDSSTLLRSLAYSVALTIRQAQTYGTSVRQFGSGSGSFNYSYGAFFDKGDTSHYYLFADVVPDFVRTSVSEDVQKFTLGSGYTIQTFCGMTGTVMTCAATCPTTLPAGIVTCSANSFNTMSVYFKRPNPDAQFYTSSGGPFAAAYVQIKGPAGSTTQIADNGSTVVKTDTRGITITSTGQISVGDFGS